ncbi:FAD-dependent oxidoreductase [Streptantibioticus rubrisoli]|uniref:FAD-dependent oxidoreductase n=1 Tax=Streptantibioticus rubrisoli TaxID=1387313 RepID=A0ABT1PEQ8_9ACTN|nr:FAD-dependent oxidoreductase [Streptantibioticus rubrisoli]MCQ4043276.1 FAD-dependent oxidoreductase [Streptantibioticus rubrisoli]
MTQSWSAQRAGESPATAGRRALPVAVVGAGPYGLSVAAHLRAARVPVRVFGEVMGSWRHAMATGMFLKSTPDATDLSAPPPSGRLADFCRTQGEPVLTELTPIPCTTFVRYGQWFQQRYVGDVDPARVTAVHRDGPTFVLRLNNGEDLAASAVVVASGLTGLAHIPAELTPLAPDGPDPAGLLSHTSQHQDLTRYAGRRVAVVGGGQSALESAALLHEAGAQATVLVRADRVRWGSTPVLERSLADRLLRPAAPLGPGWSLLAISRAPGAVRRLPTTTRLYLLRRALRPAGGWWLRDRVEGVVPVHTHQRIAHARPEPEGIRLQLASTGTGPAELIVDHVLAATGYCLDIDALPFLIPVRQAVRRVTGSAAPHLSATFESTVPGLYFTGSLAAPAFGPVMRFVAGTGYAATRIARHAARCAHAC